jgi:MYXO-CTERM domain-containing protein
MGVTDWTPTWPKPVPYEIRFDAYSSVLDGLTPALPAQLPETVGVSVVTGRGSLAVTQFPNAVNDYTLIVKFNDGFTGSQDLRGLITVVTPEPAALGTLALAGLALCRRRRTNNGLLSK